MFYAEKVSEIPIVSPMVYVDIVQKHIQELETSLEQLHKKVTTVSTARNAKSRAASKQFPFPNFDLGDFVLVGRLLARPNKLALEWTGPCRVVGVHSHWLYDVQTLYEPMTTTLHHISRLKFYCESSRASVEDLVQHAVAHQDLFLIDSLLECRNSDNQWEILVQWKGFALEEATWEPLAVLQADVPALLQQALDHELHPSFAALKAFLAGPTV
jgi:hypothetical protein